MQFVTVTPKAKTDVMADTDAWLNHHPMCIPSPGPALRSGPFGCRQSGCQLETQMVVLLECKLNI